MMLLALLAALVVPVFPQRESAEGVWDVGAMTASTPLSRRVALAYKFVPFPYVTSLRVDNSRGTSTLTLTAGGEVRYIGGAGVLTVTRAELGRIEAYTLESDADVAAGVVLVYENGGRWRAD